LLPHPLLVIPITRSPVFWEKIADLNKENWWIFHFLTPSLPRPPWRKYVFVVPQHTSRKQHTDQWNFYYRLEIWMLSWRNIQHWNTDVAASVHKKESVSFTATIWNANFNSTFSTYGIKQSVWSDFLFFMSYVDTYSSEIEVLCHIQAEYDFVKSLSTYMSSHTSDMHIVTVKCLEIRIRD
jgi:hypothetical protein